MLEFKTCRSLCSKQFCIITFFRISSNLTEECNLDIDFFKFKHTFLILV